MVNPTNTGGFENFKTPFTPPRMDGMKTFYDIRQTMVNVVELNYPEEVSTKIYQQYMPTMVKEDLKASIPSQGQLREWLGKVTAKYQHYFPDVLKCLQQTDGSYQRSQHPATFSMVLQR
jgi:hypothetical protein